MFVVKPRTLEDFRQALFILSYYHVKVAVYSDGTNPSSVQLSVVEDYTYGRENGYEKALDQLMLAGKVFDSNFDTEDKKNSNHITYTTYTGMADEDPIKKAMKDVLERDTQVIFNKLNKEAEEPVVFDFYEDMYHDKGNGPTYTIRKKTLFDSDNHIAEQVKAGIKILQVKAWAEGYIEASRVRVEYREHLDTI